jgi:hypothetical protein
VAVLEGGEYHRLLRGRPGRTDRGHAPHRAHAERTKSTLRRLIGVVGGVGGAVVGGVIANEGQEEQFEKDRAAELQDLREQTYVKFVGAAEKVHMRGRSTDAAEANAALAEVILLSPTLARPATSVLKLAGQTTGEDTKQQETVEAAFNKNLDRFVLLAQAEVGIEK